MDTSAARVRLCARGVRIVNYQTHRARGVWAPQARGKRAANRADQLAGEGLTLAARQVRPRGEDGGEEAFEGGHLDTKLSARGGGFERVDRDWGDYARPGGWSQGLERTIAVNVAPWGRNDANVKGKGQSATCD